MGRMSDFLVVIPAYNEEQTIEEVVRSAKKYADICVVDDCSTDSTPEILSREEDIYVITHERNTHIPGAVLDGMRYAVAKRYSYSITIDAGLSHDPDEIPLFINHEYADLVIGSRKRRINTPLYRKVLSFTGNFLYNISLDFPGSVFKETYYKDITSGFRRYSGKAMQLLVSEEMESKSFDFLLESAMHIYKNSLTISEVPITYRFSNSSLSSRVIKDCLRACGRSIFKHKL
jgi:dolichol-phosphate mannosyltransferase